MKRNEPIDELIRNAAIDKGLENPAEGFSDRVMNAIVQAPVPQLYRPLIPKWVIIGVLGCVVLLVAGSFLIGYIPGNTTSVWENVMEEIPEFHFQISLSVPVLYCISIVLFLLFIQAVLLGKIYRKMFK